MSQDEGPRLVFLFSGHMIDRPDRERARFPADLERAAASRISFTLAQLDAGSRDHAFCGGASGGDLLFAEACQARDVPLTLILPVEEEAFLQASVDPAGGSWRDRFHAVTASPSTSVELVPPDYAAAGTLSSHQRANRWLLERSVEWGIDRLRFICLWNRRSGDGEGGTADMVAAVRALTDQVRILDPAELG